MSVFDDAIEALLRHETADPDAELLSIGALYIPYDNDKEIECVEIPREQAQASLSGYFEDQDAAFYGIAIAPCPEVQNPSKTLLIAVYLANNQSGPTYNNRASALLGQNISGNFLLFELDSKSLRFTSNTEILRTTIAILCDDARSDSLIECVWRSFENSISKTSLGKFFEGFASVPETDDY
ncbi:MAG: hypothetical protein CMP20_09395 [Rickettsiales bacterium]|nr:hypothetical protein [Rickettsiales bacterium]